MESDPFVNAGFIEGFPTWESCLDVATFVSRVIGHKVIIRRSRDVKAILNPWYFDVVKPDWSHLETHRLG